MDEGVGTGEHSRGSSVLVLFARHPRGSKVKELTADWTDLEWSSLIQRINKLGLLHSAFPKSRILIMPDIESSTNFNKVNVHKLVRQIFVERRRFAFECPLVILSCFEKETDADRILKHSFSVFLSLYKDEGHALLLYLSDLEGGVQYVNAPEKEDE